MMKYYGLINENIDSLMKNIEETQYTVRGYEYEYILKTNSKADLISALGKIDPDDYINYTIEEFTGDEDGEFIEGSDYEDLENFLKFQDLR